MRENVKNLLDGLPTETGVYLFKNSDGEVVYVGKARNLRSRVRSYFTGPGDGRLRLPLIVENTESIETVITDDEVEALILENNLIKKYRPRYNVLFRDDKTYPSVVIDRSEPFPRLHVVRRPRPSKDKLIFGPFPSAHKIRSTVRFLNRCFKLRKCKKTRLPGGRPCLYHQIGECDGPCSGEVEPEEYNQRLEDAVLYLKGQSGELLSNLRKEMKQASENLDYEEAARLRDLIEDLESITSGGPAADQSKSLDQDVFAEVRVGDCVAVTRMAVESGRLTETDVRTFKKPPVPDDVFESVITQYYSLTGVRIPNEVLLSRELDEPEAVEEYLSRKRNRKVKLRVPSRAKAGDLVRIALQNARAAIDAEIGLKEEIRAGEQELAEMLGLEKLPEVLECFDISHLQGSHVVGAKVRFRNGRPDKEGYRRYRIKTVRGDDFGALAEAVSREYSQQQPPDLLVIDGGPGQLAAARQAMKKIGKQETPTAGIAKARKKRKTGERLFIPGKKDPVLLPPSRASSRLLVRLRDEAHRFAVTYHRLLRKKGVRFSFLDDVPGLGKKRKQKLLSRFGSVKKIQEASLEQIQELLGEKTGEKVFRAIRKEGPDEA